GKASTMREISRILFLHRSTFRFCPVRTCCTTPREEGHRVSHESQVRDSPAIIQAQPVATGGAGLGRRHSPTRSGQNIVSRTCVRLSTSFLSSFLLSFFGPWVSLSRDIS